MPIALPPPTRSPATTDTSKNRESRQLSVAAPAGSLVYVLSVAVGRYAFDEPIPMPRIIGLVLIVVGVVLVANRAGAAAG